MGVIDMKHFQTRVRLGLALPVLAAVTVTTAIAMRWSDTSAGTVPPYSINFHTISSGGSSLRNSCFHLTGTVGQAAPGYSSGSTDFIIAGFWPAAPTIGLDDIFFNGFEGC
jgi:hypothetical protein